MFVIVFPLWQQIVELDLLIAFYLGGRKFLQIHRLVPCEMFIRSEFPGTTGAVTSIASEKPSCVFPHLS